MCVNLYNDVQNAVKTVVYASVHGVSSTADLPYAYKKSQIFYMTNAFFKNSKNNINFLLLFEISIFLKYKTVCKQSIQQLQEFLNINKENSVILYLVTGLHCKERVT